MKPCTCSAYDFPHRPGSGRCQFDDAAALMWEMYGYELAVGEYVDNDQESWRETVHEIACLNELAPTDRILAGPVCGFVLIRRNEPMKYQLLPLDPELDPIDFDTQSILDLALLGPYDKDAGVVYFDGVACLEPRPDKTTMGHVRKLEAELLAMKARYDYALVIFEEVLDFEKLDRWPGTKSRVEAILAAAKGTES